MDALGYPAGKPTLEVAQAIKRPDKVSQEAWQQAISAAAELFRSSKGMTPPTKENIAICSGLGSHTINRIFDGGPGEMAFNRAMVMRGIIAGIKQLTPQMQLALSELSDYTSGESLQVRLRKLGIKWIEYQGWLKYKPFQDRMQELAEEAMKNASATAMIGLSERAHVSDSSLKYMLQLTGRYDPNRQGQADVRAFLNVVVEIIQKYLSDVPDKMRAIAGELAVLTSTHLGA
jgi:hypothetical protein